MAIVAVLLSLVTPSYFANLHRSKEAALHHDLAVMRDAIDKFYSDTGKYPDTLDDLVQEHYLRFIPEDPITGNADTWVVTPPALNTDQRGAIYDIHSGAPGEAADGSSYQQW